MKWRHLYRDGLAWLVAVKRRRRIYRRRFGDFSHGGRDVALAAAVAWRDALLRRVGPATMIRTRYAPNTSGVIGVQLERLRTRRGRPAPRWRATWYELDGRKGGRGFSILKYGARRAKALAIECRKGVVARLLEERKRMRGRWLGRTRESS